MDRPRILLLLKFGQKHHVESFAAGKLHLNTLGYFVNLEGDAARTDRNEGTGYWAQPSMSQLSMQVDGVFQEIKSITGPIRFRYPSELDVNVLCLYALRSWNVGGEIEAQTSEFGGSVAVVLDGDEFISRVRLAAEASRQQIQWSIVEYCDSSKYHGEMGIFRKPSEFEYQSEFRIALRPGTGAPLQLNVGSLDELCEVIPADELSARLTLGEDGNLRFARGSSLGGSAKLDSNAAADICERHSQTSIISRADPKD